MLPLKFQTGRTPSSSILSPYRNTTTGGNFSTNRSRYVDGFFNSLEYSGLKKEYDSYLSPIMLESASIEIKRNQPLRKTLNCRKWTIFIELKDTILHISDQKVNGLKYYHKITSRNSKIICNSNLLEARQPLFDAGIHNKTGGVKEISHLLSPSEPMQPRIARPKSLRNKFRDLNRDFVKFNSK